MAHSRGRDDDALRHFERAVEGLRTVPVATPPFFPATSIGLVVFIVGTPARPRLVFEETVFHFRRVGAEEARRLRAREPRHRPARGRAPGRGRADPRGVPRAAFATSATRWASPSRSTRSAAWGAAPATSTPRSRTLEEALALYGELGVRRQVGMALGSLGLLHGAAGDPERARARLGEALRIFEATDDAPGTAGHARQPRRASSSTTTPRSAPSRCSSALTSSGSASTQPRPASWTGFMLAHATAVTGDADGAARHYEAARDLFERLGDERGLRAVAERR